MAAGTQEMTRVNMVVRPAEEADARRLCVYFSQIAMEPGNNTGVRPGMFPLTVRGQRELIRRYAEQANSALFLAELDGKIVGVVGLEGGSTPYDWHKAVLHINVRRGYRGFGIGSTLIHKAMDWARSQPTLRRVELEVLERNTGAIRLYERMGFITEGRRHLSYVLSDEGHDELVDSRIMAYYL